MEAVHERVDSISAPDPQAFARAMFASAAHFHPRCRQVLLTDLQTAVPHLPDVDVVRLDLDTTRPMLARSIAWLAFIQQSDSHIVFLDTDILINANLDPLFARDFDVGLTYRHHRRWPINAGINFVHGDHLAGAARFHQRWLERFQTGYAHNTVWGGDQDALRDLVDEADFTRRDIFLHRQHDFEILMLPCVEYNYSSADEHGMDGDYPEKKVLHFKGRRKPNMLPYWSRM
jgi:hypothetical protein